MVKKTEQAFGELAGSVEAILTLFFLSAFGYFNWQKQCFKPNNPLQMGKEVS